LAIYLPALWGCLPLIRAEAMYALIPAEMLASHQWLTPTLNGVPYLDKPPLLYWLTLLAYKLLGGSDLAARVPVFFLTLGEVWITYLIGLRLLGTRAAWLGGFILAASVGFFALHLQLLTDHLITLTLAACLYFLLRWQEQPSFRWVALFHLTLVAGFLSKGLIALVFPLLISLLYAWHLRQSRLPHLFFSPRGLALLLLLVIPWFVAAEQAHPGLLRVQILNEQILRFMGQRQPADTYPFSLAGFWFFLALWLLPWTVLLPEALYRFWRESAGPGEIRRRRLLLLWPAVIMVFFSLSSGRIEYYSLPALPPLALILGWRVERSLAEPRDRSLPLGLLAVGLVGLAVFLWLPWLEGLCGDNRREFLGMFSLIYPVAWPATVLLPTLAGLGLVAGWRRPRVALACLGALALVFLFFTFWTLTALSPHLSDKLPGEYIRQRAAPEDVMVMESIEEFEYGASLAFYAGRRLLMVQRGGLPQFPYPVSPEADYLISPEQLRVLWQGSRRVFLLVDEATPPPEAYLQEALVALAVPGKRLLVNRP
jgi:4-amino-4-deoxy-L-arabinose transferase-like glycosyltransferase